MPRRWEVIVFRYPEDATQLWVKRVVGLPGETISLDDGDVLLNGEIARKSLLEQRALRQQVDAGDGEDQRTRLVDGVSYRTSSRWVVNGAGEIEYQHVPIGPITDESGYNQGPAPPVNRVADIMLTFNARLAGEGRLALRAGRDGGRCELVTDFARRDV